MWKAFVELLFTLLQQIYGFVGDWGLAIIVLTVIVRLLMTPLIIKQTRSMHELQKHQGPMKELQEKYADDPELQRQKLAEFTAEHRINPFGSCLPMIAQMPIFMALYQMLAGATEKGPGGPLAQHLASDAGIGSFFNIIPNIMLSPSAVYEAQGIWGALPYIILLALFGVSVYVPQLLMSSTADEKTRQTQKTTGLAMAAFLLFIGWGMPAGLLLYWDTSSIIGIGQQWFTQRTMRQITEGEDEDQKKVSDDIVPVKKSAKKPTKKHKG